MTIYGMFDQNDKMMFSVLEARLETEHSFKYIGDTCTNIIWNLQQSRHISEPEPNE